MNNVKSTKYADTYNCKTKVLIQMVYTLEEHFPSNDQFKIGKLRNNTFTAINFIYSPFDFQTGTAVVIGQ